MFFIRCLGVFNRLLTFFSCLFVPVSLIEANRKILFFFVDLIFFLLYFGFTDIFYSGGVERLVQKTKCFPCTMYVQRIEKKWKSAAGMKCTNHIQKIVLTGKRNQVFVLFNFFYSSTCLKNFVVTIFMFFFFFSEKHFPSFLQCDCEQEIYDTLNYHESFFLIYRFAYESFDVIICWHCMLDGLNWNTGSGCLSNMGTNNWTVCAKYNTTGYACGCIKGSTTHITWC